MNWDPPRSKVNVVRSYLAGSFPGMDITDDTDFDTTSRFFNISDKGIVHYRAAVPRAVIDDFTEGQITQTLRAFRLAEKMREAAPDRVTLKSPARPDEGA